jgi:hypothetical protein
MKVFTITNQTVFPYIVVQKKEIESGESYEITVGEEGEGRKLGFFKDFRPLVSQKLSQIHFKITEIEGENNQCLIVVKYTPGMRGKSYYNGAIKDFYCSRCIKNCEFGQKLCSVCLITTSVSLFHSPLIEIASGVSALGKYGDLGYFTQKIGYLKKDEILSIKASTSKHYQELSRKFYQFNGEGISCREAMCFVSKQGE